MKILVTGVAGFIGFHVANILAHKGHDIVGLDNINDYYEVELKFARLNELGIQKNGAKKNNGAVQSSRYKNFKFVRLSIENRDLLPKLFENEKFDVVCNLAAQAGVRYSIENPEAYVDSNIVGFLNVLECSVKLNVKHLVYASSSSVYGLNDKVPFETTDCTERPASLYAATKKSNELLAHAYSHLFGLKTTGLRFFTVYGPWGRPDMALFLFTKSIMNNEPIKVFNNGNMARDFTYIDDIAEGVCRVITDNNVAAPYNIYNIGNNKAISLLDFIEVLEKMLGKKAIKEMLPMQQGDVEKTWASVDALAENYGYRPDTGIEKGIRSFVTWYKEYYGGT